MEGNEHDMGEGGRRWIAEKIRRQASEKTKAVMAEEMRLQSFPDELPPTNTDGIYYSMGESQRGKEKREYRKQRRECALTLLKGCDVIIQAVYVSYFLEACRLHGHAAENVVLYITAYAHVKRTLCAILIASA